MCFFFYCFVFESKEVYLGFADGSGFFFSFFVVEVIRGASEEHPNLLTQSLKTEVDEH